MPVYKFTCPTCLWVEERKIPMNTDEIKEEDAGAFRVICPNSGKGFHKEKTYMARELLRKFRGSQDLARLFPSWEKEWNEITDLGYEGEENGWDEE